MITLLGWSKNFSLTGWQPWQPMTCQFLYHYNEADNATMSQQVIKFTEHAIFNRLTKAV
jgi:hypothetical protein